MLILQPNMPDEYMGPFATGPDGEELVNSVQVRVQWTRHFALVVLLYLTHSSWPAAVAAAAASAAERTRGFSFIRPDRNRAPDPAPASMPLPLSPRCRLCVPVCVAGRMPSWLQSCL
jgi:hypothetical protein